jgi:formyltetrahydrofolate hydrolase
MAMEKSLKGKTREEGKVVKLPDSIYSMSVRMMHDDHYYDKERETVAIRMLREALADKLVKEKVEQNLHPHFTEFRIELICMTPEEMAKVIRDRAEALAKLLYNKKGG